MTLAAAMLGGTAIVLWWPSGRWWARRRLGAATAPVPALSAGACGLVVGAAGMSLVPRVSGPAVLVGLTAAGVVLFVVRQVRRARVRARTSARRAEVGELLGLMTAELRAGALPHRLLAGLVVDFGFLAPAARAADLGGDVVAALRDASSTTGRELLGDLAGAWHVAERSGAPLADVMVRLEESARSGRDLAREVASGVAPARATGRLMAALPVLGLMLGSGMGGDPVAVLTTTWVGAACLLGGCALACAGIAWIERIADTVDAP